MSIVAKIFIIFSFILINLLIRTEKVMATHWVCPDNWTYDVCYYEMGGHYCNQIGCVDYYSMPLCTEFQHCNCRPSGQECGTRPGDVCEGASGGWNYKYDGKCVREPYDIYATCTSKWSFRYNNCSAADRCEDPSIGNTAGVCGGGGGGSGNNTSGKILAGQCSASSCPGTGCSNGGWYKSCCHINGPAQAGTPLRSLVGNCSGGGCATGVPVRWSNFGSPGPVCSPDLCLKSWDGWSWIVESCSGAPPPGTPPPGESTPPPVTSNPCPVPPYWCASSATQCGFPHTIHSQYTCNYPDEVCCEVVNGDDGNSVIELKILDKNTSVGDQVRMEVYQKPKNDADQHCYYSSIDVKLKSAPPPIPGYYHVCTATGFGPDKKTRECIWETKNTHDVKDSRYNQMPVMPFPEGDYVAEVYYGGHTDSVCGDNQAWSTDSTTLTGKSDPAEYEPWWPSDQSCSPDTQRIDITDRIFGGDRFEFNNLEGWQTLSGSTVTTQRYHDCNLRNSDGCLGHCADISPCHDCGNFLHVSSSAYYTPYTVSRRISNLEKGEYLIEVQGHGISAKLPGYEDHVKGKSLPFFQTITGGLTTNVYPVTNLFCHWNSSRIKTSVENSNYIDIYLSSRTVYNNMGVGMVPQSAFDNLKIYYCQACMDPEKPQVVYPHDGQFISEEAYNREKIAYEVDMNDQICDLTKTTPNYFEFRFSLPGGSWGDYIGCVFSEEDNFWVCPFDSITFTPGQTYIIQGNACNGYACTESDETSFTFSSEPWYQIDTGAIHANNGRIQSKIPNTATPSFLYTTIHGVATWTIYDANSLIPTKFGNEIRKAKSGDYKGNLPLYDFWEQKLDQDIERVSEIPVDSPGFYSLNSIPAETVPFSDVFKQTCNTGGNTHPCVKNDQAYVILVDKNLDIDENVTVEQGGALLVIVGGDITAAADVEEMHGFYLTDRNFTVLSNSLTDGNFQGTDIQFKFKGGIVAQKGISLYRDLGTRALGQSNHLTPAETFTYRPDIVRELRKLDQLKVFRYSWREVEP
jgi:hypothetical protein